MSSSALTSRSSIPALNECTDGELGIDGRGPTRYQIKALDMQTDGHFASYAKSRAKVRQNERPRLDRPRKRARHPYSNSARKLHASLHRTCRRVTAFPRDRLLPAAVRRLVHDDVGLVGDPRERRRIIRVAQNNCEKRGKIARENVRNAATPLANACVPILRPFLTGSLTCSGRTWAPSRVITGMPLRSTLMAGPSMTPFEIARVMSSLNRMR